MTFYSGVLRFQCDFCASIQKDLMVLEDKNKFLHCNMPNCTV